MAQSGAMLRGQMLYEQAKQRLAAGDAEQAAALLQDVCLLLPNHAAGQHLWGKASLQLGDLDKAEHCQRRSCALDPSLGWNWFALAELLEQRGEWLEAAAHFRTAQQHLPHEAWIAEKACLAQQTAALAGEDLRLGLGPQAYQLWCEQLEPRFPSILQPLQQLWWVIAEGQILQGEMPTQGWLVVLGPGYVLRDRALQALEAWLGCGDIGNDGKDLFDYGRRLAQRLTPDQPDLLSVDEDQIHAGGERLNPWFKPTNLTESFWAQPWLGGCSIWRCSWLRLHGLGAPPGDVEARQSWLWQALGYGPKHAHVPAVLVHQQASQPAQHQTHTEAARLLAYLRQLNEPVQTVLPHPERPGAFEIDWLLPQPLRCTAIVPTRNRADLLKQCLESVTATATQAKVELDWIVVDNGSDQPALHQLLEQWQQRLGTRLRVLREPRPFNWSLLNNQAAALSDADLLLFLNNDIQALEAGWLEVMAAQASREAVGCVGARLLYPDQSLQHAGVVVGLHGGADHAYRGHPLHSPAHRGRGALLSDWGAVTGAALMVKRELFERVGGFDPQLPVEFNDVDFCLRLGQLGLRHVIDPRATLIHHESQSRDALASPTARPALELMRSRWGARMHSTAPWWPQACSSRWSDGRPRELDLVQ
jgi:GT2 family glycosyltransferase/tetratricopeptide (TPR) repeat protein